jgi:hypothetical protein
MDPNERQRKLEELSQLRARTAELERELNERPSDWQAREFYLTYYATTGFVLGMLAAITSLLFNVIGSLLVNQHPLKLIQIYLTFPLGERALQLDSSLTLTLGCCLYMATGMLLGVPFYVLLVKFTSNSGLVQRIIFASFLAISMWFVHYYLILNFLQPALFGGNWIVQQIPWWVGALTHLVYGWTLVATYPLGLYVPYHRPSETVA